MYQRVSKFVGVALLLVGVGCSSSNAPDGLTKEEQVKYEQYFVAGMTLYQTHCSNCHQQTGEGLGNLYPPLKKSDYLKNNLEASICIVKNGMKGDVKVNGKTYNQPMPGNPELTPLEIAEIITYVNNSWGNNGGFTKVKKVVKVLESCQGHL